MTELGSNSGSTTGTVLDQFLNFSELSIKWVLAVMAVTV